jgi:hypothetical protein
LSKLKRGELVDLQLTTEQLLKIYIIMGRANGSNRSSVWELVKDKLGDHNRRLYNKMTSIERNNILDYCRYENDVEKAYFDKSDTEKELDEVSKQISQLEAIRDQLKREVEKENK